MHPALTRLNFLSGPRSISTNRTIANRKRARATLATTESLALDCAAAARAPSRSEVTPPPAATTAMESSATSPATPRPRGEPRRVRTVLDVRLAALAASPIAGSTRCCADIHLAANPGALDIDSHAASLSSARDMLPQRSLSFSALPSRVDLSALLC